MKISIIIETREDLDRVVPLLAEIHQLQIVGKYLFYRLVCICKNHEEKELKKCMKKHKINVPYSFWEKDENGEIFQIETLPHFFEEELFRNPVEMIMLLHKNSISQKCRKMAHHYKVKVALFDDEKSAYEIKSNMDIVFSLTDLENPASIVQEIVKMYQL